jgi:hypothetical protein
VSRLPPLLREFLVAALSMSVLGTVIAVGFYLVTGLSPWPFVILAEIAGFGFGTVMLALSTPRDRS